MITASFHTSESNKQALNIATRSAKVAEKHLMALLLIYHRGPEPPGFEILTSPLTSSNVTGSRSSSDRGRLSDELPPQSEMCKGSCEGGYGLQPSDLRALATLPISSVVG
ncbi:hypothetical protein EVAR_90269_1 [Eumeta japonica]|uniref:Uncharacterized protein n=1 Tax=Eumeta variegata TaxID=151549 RepID=A0A4C2AB93_EUMVA|nr:hypothetical protein EVAR_90269_1 [Eumeta japonica]